MQLFGRKLFAQHHSIKIFYEVVPSNADTLLQFGFGVSKKNTPKSTQRNKIKRQLREAIRLHKPTLYKNFYGYTAIFFLHYIAKEHQPFEHIKHQVIVAMSEIEKRVLI